MKKIADRRRKMGVWEITLLVVVGYFLLGYQVAKVFWRGGIDVDWGVGVVGFHKSPWSPRGDSEKADFAGFLFFWLPAVLVVLVLIGAVYAEKYLCKIAEVVLISIGRIVVH